MSEQLEDRRWWRRMIVDRLVTAMLFFTMLTASFVVSGLILGACARTYVQWEAQRISNELKGALKK